MQCRNCGSFDTVSGKANLKRDLGLAIGLGILSLGIALVFIIPYMLWQLAVGNYIPDRYECIMCKHKWNEDAHV